MVEIKVHVDLLSKDNNLDGLIDFLLHAGTPIGICNHMEEEPIAILVRHSDYRFYRDQTDEAIEDAIEITGKEAQGEEEHS